MKAVKASKLATSQTIPTTLNHTNELSLAPLMVIFKEWFLAIYSNFLGLFVERKMRPTTQGSLPVTLDLDLKEEGLSHADLIRLVLQARIAI